MQMGETETVIFITTDKNGERIDYRIQLVFKQQEYLAQELFS